MKQDTEDVIWLLVLSTLFMASVCFGVIWSSENDNSSSAEISVELHINGEKNEP